MLFPVHTRCDIETEFERTYLFDYDINSDQIFIR